MPIKGIGQSYSMKRDSDIDEVKNSEFSRASNSLKKREAPEPIKELSAFASKGAENAASIKKPEDSVSNLNAEKHPDKFTTGK